MNLNNALVWIIDDDQSIRWVLEKTLAGVNVRTQVFEDAQSAFDDLASLDHDKKPKTIICDIRMPKLSGIRFLKLMQEYEPHIPIIMMTAHSDLDAAVSSYQTGAFEYLPKPFDIDTVIHTVARAIEHANSVQHPEPQNNTNEVNVVSPLSSDTFIIGESPAMQEVFRIIGRLSTADISVLINGESGTGKELVAHALHYHSPRKKHPFIALNMAAIPRDLIESELFGHEKGAFTGANTQRVGRFEQADGGTLFLDEIGDMPFETQTRLLRVLAEGEFYRIGSRAPIHVNVRIIAATHKNLEQLVKDGLFREDLYHRLNVIKIELPPLRERPEDIEALCHFFLKRASQELHIPIKQLSTETLRILERQPWPGNVRQLSNVCQWLTVMASGQTVLPHDLPPDIQHHPVATLPTKSKTYTVDTEVIMHGNTPLWLQPLRQWADALLGSTPQLMDVATPLFERVLLEAALNKTQGHKQNAAHLLGWGRNTITRKLQEFNLQQESDAE